MLIHNQAKHILQDSGFNVYLIITFVKKYLVSLRLFEKLGPVCTLFKNLFHSMYVKLSAFIREPLCSLWTYMLLLPVKAGLFVQLQDSLWMKGNAKEFSNYCIIALILYASKVMFKSLQARLQQF